MVVYRVLLFFIYLMSVNAVAAWKAYGTSHNAHNALTRNAAVVEPASLHWN